MMRRYRTSAVALLVMVWFTPAQGQPLQAAPQTVRNERSAEQGTTLRGRRPNTSQQEREGSGPQRGRASDSPDREIDHETALKDLTTLITEQKDGQQQYLLRLKRICRSALKDEVTQTVQKLDELCTEWQRDARYWDRQLEKRIGALRRSAPSRQNSATRRPYPQDRELDRETALKDLESLIAKQRVGQKQYLRRLREICRSAPKDETTQTAEQLDKLHTEWRPASGDWHAQIDKRVSALRRSAPSRQNSGTSPPPSAQYQSDWSWVLKQNTKEAYEEFLRRYPQGKFTDSARGGLQRLREPQDWSNATSRDTLEAYEEFLWEHPKSERAQQAREMWWQRLALEDWRRARLEDTIEAYENFLQEHPESQQAKEARSRLDAMNADFDDWTEAQKTNMIEGYAHFLRLHPSSPFADKARGRIVDIEVSDILGGEHDRLPSVTPVGSESHGTHSIVNVHNGTRYSLTIRYSGPESFKVVFAPNEKGSIQVLRGAYKVAASVDAPNVRPYAGEEELDGRNYAAEYYIGSQFGIPRVSPPGFGGAAEFRPFPTKRSVPDYLK